ncbi:LbetaH domain-containing protein [Neorhizobium alkalisoli]|uniref:putative colanic acid biosynthesis acetyltransferase n=1 Tax=Neorhizobium alkalisoli TaxID=528178 RepID=UPI000CF9699C
MSNDFSQYRYIDTIPKAQKIRRALWLIVWVVLFRPTPRGLMNFWRIFLLRAFGAKIGNGCRVAPSCSVWAPWNLEMGQYSVLGDGVDCYSMDKIRIGSKVAISQRSFLCTGTHDISSLRRPLITKPISIGDHCWVAAESMLMPGVTIGAGAVIGTRSLVSKSLPAWFVCVGHPCAPVRPRAIKEVL